MKSESIGSNVNVRIREIDRITGKVVRSIVKHNKITRTGLGIIADYISAYFNSGNLLNVSSSDVEVNKIDYINKFKTLLQNLPYKVYIGTDGSKEEYNDIGIRTAIIDPITSEPIHFQLSNGSSTLQSALSGSLTSTSTSGYKDGITISYTFLSRSDTFENFSTRTDSVVTDNEGNPIYIRELALMNYIEDKCWARVSLIDGDVPGILINKNRVYDILWNINLVSINTQLIEINS